MSSRPRKPLDRNYGSPESPKKPKPRYSKKNKYNSRTRTKMATGVVTALRYDGTVNLRINGFVYMGVQTAAEYDPREVGNTVKVFMQDGNPYVLGKIASDDFEQAPTVFPTESALWSWALESGDRRMFFNQNIVGRKSEKFPTDDSDYLLRLGFGYGGTDPNAMNGPATTTSTIDFFVERDEWDDGYEGPSSFNLFALKNGSLPTDPAGLQYQLALDPSRITFTCEPGQLTLLTLPGSWVESIGDATPDANTIRGFIIEPYATEKNSWAIGDHTYAKFTDITGALRINNGV